MTSLILSLLLLVSGTACSEKQDTAAQTKFADKTLSLNTAAPQDSGLVNLGYRKSAADFDYNVYGIYLKVYPTYDEDGDLVTRRVYENIVARDRRYNPTLDCDVWYTDSPVSDFKALEPLKAMDGTIRVRGNSSRGNPMKNFKVKLGDGQIFGYDSLNINKHFMDDTRALNKFCMDMMQLLPTGFVSMETKFVHLYISDVAEDGTESGFVDQGIYTFVEQPNRDYLRRHGLDPNGSIYKSMAFEFLPYEDKLRAPEDPLYDENVYNDVIKPTANGDHEGLRNMLDAVNNYSLDFNQVMAQYFDEENYLSWMALNILLGNIDTLAHNFLLYSPSNSEKWYFLPWDFDGAMNDYGVTDMGINPYQSFGIHFYWSVPLHQRYFRIEGNIQKLNNKINEVMNTYITAENVAYAQEKTLEAVLPFYADLQNHENPVLASVYRKNVDHIQLVTDAVGEWYQSIQNNYDRYYLNLENPTSSNISRPTYENGEWVFRWEASYDFQHEPVTYDFYLASDPEFSNIIAQGNDLSTPIFTVSKLPKGLLYFQYVAKDSSGHIQYPLNRLSVKDLQGNTLVRKRGVEIFDNDSGEVYIIENEIFGDDFTDEPDAENPDAA